jgi:hypothetical protein
MVLGDAHGLAPATPMRDFAPDSPGALFASPIVAAGVPGA